MATLFYHTLYCHLPFVVDVCISFVKYYTPRSDTVVVMCYRNICRYKFRHSLAIFTAVSYSGKGTHTSVFPLTDIPYT